MDYSEQLQNIKHLLEQAVSDYCHENKCSPEEAAAHATIIIAGNKIKMVNIKPFEY